MTSVKTIKVSGGDYAKVAVRLAEFRKSNPRAKITTKPVPQPDGGMIFYASILRDKADENSAESTGSAYYSANQMRGSKAFEKLETISVGRALSLLGYLNNGEIATSEEMEEYEDWKNRKSETTKKEFVAKLRSSKSLGELQKNFSSGINQFKGNDEFIAEIIKIKDELKGSLK